MSPSADWPTVRLGDVVRIKHGFAFSGMAETTDTSLPVVLGIGNFDYAGGFRLGSTTLKRYGGDYPKEYELKPGDVLLAMTCQTSGGEILGVPGVIPDDEDLHLHNQRLGKVEVLDPARVLLPFIFQLCRWSAFNRHLFDTASGSKILHTSPGRIEDFEFGLPPLEEQRTIAATLGALDDKIEANRRAIRLMEQLGAAHMEEHVKLDAYGFPEYGVKTLGDMLSVLETGSRPRGGVSTETRGVVSLGAESIQSAGVISTTRFKFVTGEFANSMKRGRLVDGDVLVYKDGGTPGNFRPHVSAFGFGFPTSEATINEHVYRVRAVNEISQAVLYWVLRSEWMDHEMRKRGTGVAIPGLNSANFRSLPWPVVDATSLKTLNSHLRPLMERMLRLGAESARLAALRDALLPELLSGRFQIAEWT